MGRAQCRDFGARRIHRCAAGSGSGTPLTEDALTLKPGPAKKLIVTVNESARWHGRSVYNALLELFQRKGLAGATVSRGIAGFTGRGTIQTINIPDLSSPLPVRIEIVASAEPTDRVLPDVYDMAAKALTEAHETTVVRFA